MDDAEEHILIRVLPPGLFPQDGTCDPGERCAAGDHLGTARLRWYVDQPWTRHARSRGQRRSAWRTLAGKADPRRLPPTSEPHPDDRLVRGSPGGVWARDIPLCRRAVPGHRHGGTPARCVFKPRGRWWVLGRHGTTRPISRGVPKLVRGRWGRWDSNPPPRCTIPRGPGREDMVTCGFFVPVVTARAHRKPAVPDVLRTHHGPSHAVTP
jgi:hypothetical protein